jgi:CNT family concentrative nucleoside transporter
MVPIEIFGILLLLTVAFVFSERKLAINPWIVITALALQAGMAVFALEVPFGQAILAGAAAGVQKAIGYSDVGAKFIFGDLVDGSLGFIFAVKILPAIIFISSLTALLYHLGVMQAVVRVLGGALRMIVPVSRVESLCAASNVFLGPIESPLIVRPYLARLTRSQLFSVMTVGLASVAGGVLVGYAAMGIQLDYLIAAAFMTAPGGLLIAKIMVPDLPEDRGKPDAAAEAVEGEQRPANVIEAAADGATAGVILAAGIGASLIAFVAIISMANGLVSYLGGLAGMPELTFELILGWAFAPLMYLLGVPWNEAITAGNLVGQKTILNEFLAFANFNEIKDTLSPRTQAIVIFALCGFANFNALAITISGMGAMLPERKSEIARMGLKVVLAATLANLMSAGIAGLLFTVRDMLPAGGT